MRVFVEHGRPLHAGRCGVELVERCDERRATRSEASRDRALLAHRQEARLEATARQAHLPRGAHDLGLERIGHPCRRTAYRLIPRGGPGTTAGHLEHLRTVLARRRPASLPCQLQHGRGELLADIVEWHPRGLAAPRDDHPAEGWRQLRDAEWHRNVHRAAMRARCPVRRS